MRHAAAAALVLSVAMVGCREGHQVEERPAARPVPAAGDRAPGAEPSVGVVGPSGDSRMPKLVLLLEDPRLAAVRDFEQAHDAPGAARAFEAARAAVDAREPRACAWDYLGGRLHSAAGETADAAAHFERVLEGEGPAGAPPPSPDAGGPNTFCALSPYAALRAAQALVRLGRYDDAIGRARAVGEDTGAFDEAQLTLADAYVGKATRASAVPIWRALLAAKPHGLRWEDSALQLAAALLDGADGSPDLHATEAFDLTTRVLVEAPSVAERIDVAGLRARAWSSGLRHAGAPPPLTPEERAQQAQAWLDTKQPKRATELAEAILKTLPRPSKEHRAAACKASIVRAQARPRGRSEDLADSWGAAVARCDGDDSLVIALYYGGKASVSAHRPSEALERFANVEKLFPTHRLADDACFRAALIACDEGDDAHGLARLESLPDSYPDGDMGGEALFRVAIAKLAKQELDGARDALDRLVASGLDVGRDVAGRGAYFRARVAELSGDGEDAQRRYAAILDAHQLG